VSDFSSKINKELRQCASDMVSDCGLTAARIDALDGNPAGTGRADYVNPHYKGKITFQADGKIAISLTYILTGNKSRAKAAIKNIRSVYATQNILVNFIPNPGGSQKHDLRLHGASLGDFASGLKACDCQSMLKIGGWAPSYKNPKWGDTLLVNPHTHRIYWKNSDAHEFGHKLGLRHRSDLGIMDYWNEKKYRRDPRKLQASDKDRIARLYR
jgi:hypothetical protein